MFQIDMGWISGMVVGIELASSEDYEDPNISWGFCLNLFILRVVFTFFE